MALSHNGAPVYRDMTRAVLDAAYNNSAAVTDSPQWLERWRADSARLRANSIANLNVQYGSQPRERLDYFSSGTKDAPLFVFIHGGYWQRNEKDTFSFVVNGPRAHGIDVAVVGYTLAPEARLTDIVAEIKQSLTFLASKAPEFGFDNRRMIVGGWSAGGHLTAAIADHPAVAGGLPISGIFDLEPIAFCYLNDNLKLDPSEILTLSPLRNLRDDVAPLRMFVGANELPELKRQSETYERAALEHGLPVKLTMLPGHHHFSILDELANSDGIVTCHLVDLIRSLSVSQSQRNQPEVS